MKKHQTRFMPIAKRERVGCMVAGDQRKMVDAHMQSMKDEAAYRVEVLDLAKSALGLLKKLHNIS